MDYDALRKYYFCAIAMTPPNKCRDNNTLDPAMTPTGTSLSGLLGLSPLT